jgi:hypothetical protein
MRCLIQLIGSWFSAQSALSVYNGFLDLDADRSGMLCQVRNAFTDYTHICTSSFVIIMRSTYYSVITGASASLPRVWI